MAWVCRRRKPRATLPNRAATAKRAMSDKHDHKHDHGHEHDHDHGDIKLPVKETPAAAPAPTAERAQEDAGSTALSEALKSSFAIVKVLMILLVIAFFASGIFTVGS